ncbi:MAG: 2-phospho-L-lactate guanylyltransferase [Streptomycetaceae bacterium]|nr:2-phospho-L-lactate guanylyltransferase [Streptomycetaceae bacterium]
MPPSGTLRQVGWTVLVPLKNLASAKSRLRAGRPGDLDDHTALVLAMAYATVTAAGAAENVAEVVVVTADPLIRSALKATGARYADDPGGGLNAALRSAAHDGAYVAALTGDVPALRPAELTEALRYAGTRRCFVPDEPGTGTVLLAAPAGVPLEPRFGPDSARAHEVSGAFRLDGDWPTLRRDVDTAADLDRAVLLGWKAPAVRA